MEVAVEVDGLLPTAALDHVEAAELSCGAAVTQHLAPVPLAACRANTGKHGQTRANTGRHTSARGGAGSPEREDLKLFGVARPVFAIILGETALHTVEM